MAKTVLDAHGLPQTRWRALDRSGSRRPGLAAELLAELGPVVFVKPANMGSSIGVSRATDATTLRAALDLAFAYDELVVVEEGVVARELECGILGNGSPRASVVGEIVPAADFYDYEDKYADGAAKTGGAGRPARGGGGRGPGPGPAHLPCPAGRGHGPGRHLLGGVPDGGPAGGRWSTRSTPSRGSRPSPCTRCCGRPPGCRYPALVDELVRLALERHGRRSGRSVEHRPGRAG